MKVHRVVLCGNPNVGKSTVFNALTGLKQHTGNWTGKTVESAAGMVYFEDNRFQLIDLPGTYSLLNGSPEEMVTSDFLTFESYDAAVVVCDAGSLERGLSLLLLMVQACPNLLLCVNMMDEAKKRGIEMNTALLEKLLEIPVVAVSASKKEGLKALKQAIVQMLMSPRSSVGDYVSYSTLIEQSISLLEAGFIKNFTKSKGRLMALRALTGDSEFVRRLAAEASDTEKIMSQIETERRALQASLGHGTSISDAIITQNHTIADSLCSRVRSQSESSVLDQHQLRADRLMARKSMGIPLMLLSLGVILYITLLGANAPSAWLSEKLQALQPLLIGWMKSVSIPDPIIHCLVHGVYRTTAWVISVMLPPMAIFFPLFTLLEDWGFLPRIAFHLDRCFQRCGSCGRQALCMCMGLGCNAVGVTGCRIIHSRRERLIAMLTNALIPCNGRFPTLIALVGMFWIAAPAGMGIFIGAAWLAGLIVLCVGVTLACSLLLSKTLLRGSSSSFVMELPPYRTPKIGEVVVRSILDRTLFVLGRSVAVAAPAGLVVWLMGNIATPGGDHLLSVAAQWLDPAGRFLGMDGAILLAFILGLPANEIVLPLMMMIYLGESTLTEAASMAALKELFVQNGWTLWTAISVTLFSLFHWPCSTTILTIRKETHSWKWTFAAIALPTAVGCLFCAAVSTLGRFIYG